MLPESYEQELIGMQHTKRASIFACTAYTIYSNRIIQIAPGVETHVVNSDLKCSLGGEFHTALNNKIFMAVWAKVFEDADFQHYGWTVKVDPDCVFFPDRLQSLVSPLVETPNGVYLNNCRYGLHGPIEVFSRNAVKTWSTGSGRCLTHFHKVCSGPCFWGEDMFIDQCLWKVLNVNRVDELTMLVEDHCDPPQGWQNCYDKTRSAYHPFKSVKGYSQCLGNAGF